jgi:hypothetical protein
MRIFDPALYPLTTIRQELDDNGETHSERHRYPQQERHGCPVPRVDDRETSRVP